MNYVERNPHFIHSLKLLNAETYRFANDERVKLGKALARETF